jgi:hypothetical protein
LPLGLLQRRYARGSKQQQGDERKVARRGARHDAAPHIYIIIIRQNFPSLAAVFSPKNANRAAVRGKKYMINFAALASPVGRLSEKKRQRN